MGNEFDNKAKDYSNKLSNQEFAITIVALSPELLSSPQIQSQALFRRHYWLAAKQKKKE